MIEKRRWPLVIFLGLTVLGLFVASRRLPRQYYRYGEGRTYVVRNPNAVWNGLWRGPILQFEVPRFVRVEQWAPAPEQIRRELAKSYSELSEDQVSRIIQLCVPCGKSAV